MGEYFPIKKLNKFKTINSKKDLQNFVQKITHVTQTLYGYLKTRIGTRYVAMLKMKNLESINIAKWNICCCDFWFNIICIFSSYKSKNLKQNDAEEIFLNIINESLKMVYKKK